ncbi:MAG: hypothetical protein EAX90_00335 [Candidatus Heimdallarchaeota archaeon]|nr:hypothetical protein [Candidatus Heimdallarchaeota archaeon]
MINVNNKKRTLISTLIIVSIISILSIQANTVNGRFPVEFYPGENFSWEIDNISDGTNQWINWSSMDFSSAINWYANNSDILQFTVEDYVEIESKNFLRGSLSMGNLSISTSDYNIGSNLALSTYPWVGGLVSLEEDWETLKTENPFDTDAATIQYEQKIVLGVEINTVIFSYNESFQQTELVYEEVTGILVSVNTTAGLFHLEMHLLSSSVPLPALTSNTSLLGLGCFITSGLFLVIRQKIRTRS